MWATIRSSRKARASTVSVTRTSCTRTSTDSGLRPRRRFHDGHRGQPLGHHLRDRCRRRCLGSGHRPRDESTREVSEVMSMPRTIKDILDHADELAKRFEDYEPSATDERDPAVFAELRRNCAELCCRDRMPNARSETRSNTRANAVTPGRSSARWSEPPAKQPVSVTVISKTYRPNGFGAVRDQSEATHALGRCWRGVLVVARGLSLPCEIAVSAGRGRSTWRGGGAPG